MTEVNAEAPVVAAPVADDDFPVGTLADILAFDDTKETWVNVPEWKCKVKVKTLSKAEQIRARRGATVRGELDEGRLEGLLLVTGIVEPKFSKDHIDRLLSKNAAPLDRLLQEIMGLSDMSDDVAKEADADFPE